MTEQSKAVSNRRAKRIRRLKRVIIMSVLGGILVPTILCIFLGIRVSRLEAEITQLSAQKSVQEKLLKEYEEQAGRIEAVTEDETSFVQTEPFEEEAVAEKEAETAEAAKKQDEAVKEIHLTFDDGPSAMTDDILDILKEYDVKATFFVNGREDEQSLAMYRRIVEEGHALGMHSYTHRYGEVYASKEAFIEDTKRLQELLEQTTGEKPVLYRFPGGSSNRVGNTDMDELIDWLEEQGIAFFDWNISSGDSTKGGLSVQQIVSNCTNTIPNHEEPVILMHDSGAKRTTVEALPLVIEKIQAMDGVRLTAITKETEPVHHVR